MAIFVYRVYSDSDTDTPTQYPENHFISIVADETSAKYVSAKNREVQGLNDERISLMKERLWDKENPTTSQEWADIALYRLYGDVIAVEDYTDMAEAISKEESLLNEAQEMRDELEDSEDNDNDEDGLLVEEDEEGSVEEDTEKSVTASVDACPPSTQNIELNLANREKAIKDAGYGPLNPAEANDEFWNEKSQRWSVSTDEAKKSLCGNCVMFITTTKMKECIAQGIEQGGSSEQNAWDAIDAAELGYCEAFDFKCAASRTCNAWVTGGPIDDSKSKEQ